LGVGTGNDLKHHRLQQFSINTTKSS